MAKIVGKTLGMVGYGTGGLGTNNWAADMEANLRKIDAILQAGAIAIQNGPPGSPVDGQVYVVGTSPTGSWASQANAIARWNGAGNAWEFFAPAAGWWIAVGAQDYRYSGSAWVAGWTAAHGATHEFGGADPITGQNLTGLRVTDSVEFSGLTLRGGILVKQDTTISSNSTDGNEQTALSFAGGGAAGSDRGAYIVARGNERPGSGGTLTLAAGDGIQGVVDVQTAGVTRFQVTKAGATNFSYAIQMAGVDAITSAREGRFTGLRLSNLPVGSIPVCSDGNGQISASGQSDDGTYLSSTRNLRLWNTRTKSGNTWTDFQWTQDAQERISILSSDGSGTYASHTLAFAHANSEAVDQYLGGVAWAQPVTGKSGGSPGLKANIGTYAKGAGGSVGGFGGQLRFDYRPDNGNVLITALRIGAFGGSTPDAVETSILLRANADFLTNYAKIQKDADASVGLDVIGPSGTGKFRMLNSVGGSVLGINVGSLEISCSNGVGIGTSAGNASILVSTGDVSIARTYFSGTHRILPTLRTTSASTAIDDRLVIYTGTTNQTESLPAATGSNRVIEFAHASSSGTWTLDADGTDEIAGELQARVGSIAILSNSSVKNRTLLDFAPGLWVVI
jgi:hypothetical protein